MELLRGRTKQSWFALALFSHVLSPLVASHTSMPMLHVSKLTDTEDNNGLNLIVTPKVSHHCSPGKH